MADKVVGIVVSIQGKNDLSKSLTEINKDLSKTTSALKDVDKALQLDPTNLELAAQKQALLTKAIEETEDKLSVMRQVAEDAAKGLAEGTVSQEQYAQLTAEIVKTEAGLKDLQSQAGGTAGEMDEIGEGADEAGEEMAELAEESKETSGAMKALEGVAAATGAAMAAAFTAALAAAKEVAGALVEMTNGTADYVDEINTLSSKTGISTEHLQEMKYAFDGLIDVSMDTVTGSMTKLEKSMASAASSQEKLENQAEAWWEQVEKGTMTMEEYDRKVAEGEDNYTKLGISIRDSQGNLRDSEEVFWDVIDALGQMEDGTERDLLAMELMGKSAKDLNPLIEAGSEKFRDLAQEAHDVGYVIEDQGVLDAFQEYDDQMERLSKGAEAAKRGLGQILLPSLNSLATSGTSLLNKFSKGLQESGGDVSKVGDLVSELLPEFFNEINKFAPQLFSLIGSVVETLGQILIDNLPMLIDSAMQIIDTLTQGLLSPDNISKIIDAALSIVLNLVSYILANIDKITQAAVQIIVAVVKGIADSLPQLIPAAVDAILTICETLLAPENLALLLDASLQLVIGLTEGIISSLPQLIERLPEIIIGIVDFLLGPEGLDKLISTGFDLFVGLVTKMPDVITEILGAVGGLIGDIVGKIVEKGVEVWDACKEMFPSLDDVMTWGSDMIHGIIDGITGALGDLWDACTVVASGIADFLGFSVPEKGPLHEWAFNNPGSDMVDLWAEGVEKELPTLQTSLDLMASTIQSGTSPDYSDTLSSIDSTLGSIASTERVQETKVYIGTELFATQFSRIRSVGDFFSGGR